MEDLHGKREAIGQNKDRGLGRHICQLRTACGMTLGEMALRSNMSAVTLSRIENGEVSPNARTLGELAAALGVTISTVVVPLETDFAPLMRVKFQSVRIDESAGFERRAVSPAGTDLSIELVSCRAERRQTIGYARPAIPGQERHLLVLEGRLIVTINGEASQLADGDCLRSRLFGSSSFQTEELAIRYLLALRTDT